MQVSPLKKGEWHKVKTDDDLLWMMMETSPVKKGAGVVKVKEEPQESPERKRQKCNESTNESPTDSAEQKDAESSEQKDAEPVQSVEAEDKYAEEREQNYQPHAHSVE